MNTLWLADPGPLLEVPEAVLRFETPGGRGLVLASNLPYELWLDGVFLGDGGHRCVQGEALADRWPEARDAERALVRLHWLHPGRSGVTYRLPFADPFLAELTGPGPWSAAREAGLRFGARMSGHLARQNVLVSAAREPLELAPVERPAWRARLDVLRRARYVEVEPRLLTDRLLAGVAGEPLDPRAWSDLDLSEWLLERRGPLRCRSFDLGALALHRFEVDARAGAALLCVSEVADFAELWSGGRAGVALVDAAAEGVAGAPFGQRGGRYLHVLSDPGDSAAPAVRAQRREYPLRWREVRPRPGAEPVLEAARATLVAVVDGGLVDSCWRERVQWTGDARMSALALKALADAPEVVALALNQIAASYCPEAGMVRGAWPSPPGAFMPPYHLAFCLAALEHDPALPDPRVRLAVERSLARWREAYLGDGLVATPPGWTFTDWAPGALETMGWSLVEGAPHALVNAWWVELCGRRGEASGVDPARFEEVFGCGPAYRLSPAGGRATLREGAGEGGALDRRVPDVPDAPSPHATAVALSAGLARGERAASARTWLEAEWRAGRLKGRVTPYFATFVAWAFARHDPALARELALDVYGEEARRFGTFSEKGTPDASRAHGWSVGAVSLLIQDA